MLKVPITFNGHTLGTIDLVITAGFIASLGNTLATVATTGNYANSLSKPTKLSQFTNDLTELAPQVQSNWMATNGDAQILNQPTSLSQFDLTSASGDWSLTGQNFLNFGSDVFKEDNAGKIAY